MRKLKRIAAVLLAGVLALSMLTGCAQSGKDEFGEYLLDGVLMSIGNSYLDGQKYENAPDLEEELQKWIRDSVDPETGEIKSDVNRRPVYTPDQEKPTKISYYGICGVGTEAQDFNELNVVDGIGWLVADCGRTYSYIPQAYNAERTKFSVTYQVLTDKEGNEHLYFAYGIVMTPKAN